MRFVVPFLIMVFAAIPAWPDEVVVLPPASAVNLRSYGFGLIPLDGTFTRFHGWMRYDPVNTGVCQVMLEIEAGSLSMSNETIRARITGPGMMDVSRFQNLAFSGTCQGDVVAGSLTLHGETHPVSLAYTRSAGTIVATGEIRRADWGLTGSPLIGGPVIRIQVRMPDPASGSHS